MNQENDHMTTMPQTTRPPHPPADFDLETYALAAPTGVLSPEAAAAGELERDRVPALAGAAA